MLRESFGDVTQLDRRCVGREADDRARVLAEPGVRRGDHCQLRDLGQCRDGFLDLRGGEVLAASDDHVVQPVGDREEAVVVEHAHVAGAVPAVVVERAVVQRRIRVADEEVGTA